MVTLKAEVQVLSAFGFLNPAITPQRSRLLMAKVGLFSPQERDRGRVEFKMIQSDIRYFPWLAVPQLYSVLLACLLPFCLPSSWKVWVQSSWVNPAFCPRQPSQCLLLNLILPREPYCLTLNPRPMLLQLCDLEHVTEPLESLRWPLNRSSKKGLCYLTWEVWTFSLLFFCLIFKKIYIEPRLALNSGSSYLHPLKCWDHPYVSPDLSTLF